MVPLGGVLHLPVAHTELTEWDPQATQKYN